MSLMSINFGKHKRVAEVAVQHLIERLETRNVSPRDEQMFQHYSFPKMEEAKELAMQMGEAKGYKHASRMELSPRDICVVREALRYEIEDALFEHRCGVRRPHYVQEALQSLGSTFQIDLSSIEASK